MQQSMYSPTHPTAGQPGGSHGGYLGVCCLFKPMGCGGFLKFCPQIGIMGFVYIENHSDYSSDCYKIKLFILQNIEAVMFKFSGGGGCSDCRGVRGVSNVEGDRRGEGRQPCSRWWLSAMFKLMTGGGSEGHQPCSRWWEGVRGVSYVQGDGRGMRGFSHVQGDGRGVRGASHVKGDGRGLRGVSHVPGDWRGLRGVSHVPGDWRGLRGVSHVQGDGRGWGLLLRQPCSRWWEGDEGLQPCSRWWAGGEGRQPC